MLQRYQDILAKYRDADITSSVLFDDTIATNDTDVTKDDTRYCNVVYITYTLHIHLHMIQCHISKILTLFL